MFVFCAFARIARKNFRAFRIHRVFARMPVKAHGAERQGLMMLNEYVPYVGNRLLRTNIQGHKFALEAAPTDGARFVSITAIRRLPPEPVYNMEVEQHHNFAVNGGLIVHNCLDAIRYATESLSANRVAKTSNF